MIVKLKGGLGNQMFQYAFGRMLQKKYGINNIKYDNSYIRNFKKKMSSIDGLATKCDYASQKELNKYLASHMTPYTFSYRVCVAFDKTIHKKNYYFEKNRAYVNPDMVLEYNYLDGYWQSYRHVQEIREELLEEFKTKEKLSPKTQEYIDRISQSNSVLVGIRLGDYMASKGTRQHFFQSDNDYYNSAMKKIAEKIEDPQFIVFTNCVKECKETYKFDYPVIFRENEDFVNDYEELQVMRNCRHAIIAASSFHWWGAWLIENKDKIVVRPPQWFIDGKPYDIVPPEWETI